MRKICLPLICWFALFFCPPCLGEDGGGRERAAPVSGVEVVQSGDSVRAIEVLAQLAGSAPDPESRARARGELGVALLQARRFGEAEAPLAEAMGYFAGRAEQARFAIAFGNLAFARRQPAQAAQAFGQALVVAPDDAAIRFAAELGLARLADPQDRLQRLQTLSGQVSEAGLGAARQHLAIGQQARRLGLSGQELAYRHLAAADRLSEQQGQPRLRAEALDALAQLYEDGSRRDEALALTRAAVGQARTLPAGDAADLMIALEWRQARLLRTSGRVAAALGAYRRAIEQIEAVRQDIPIDDEDGRSTYSATLEPLYLGYLGLLLAPGDAISQADLRRAVDTVELIRQTEMQDFLGDRCSVEAVQGGGTAGLGAGQAVLYPVILPARLELLLVTPSGVRHRSLPVAATAVRYTALAFADALRNGANGYREHAQQLHRWLLQPFADDLARESVQQLIVVPDGPLRLVPMAALHDGRQFAIESRAISMVTGLSMTHTARVSEGVKQALVAGVAMPGQVVEKMLGAPLERVVEASTAAASGLARNAQTRSLRAAPAAPPAGAPETERKRAVEALRASLALPGVRDEVEALKHILPGTALLDEQFTVGHFHDESSRGEYRIVHIASHGLFGGSAEASFIMAYDDLLSMNGLETLLRSDRLRGRPIELLGLSACQTAEGNDRAPLGFAGAAIKARARAVLGTLWPVEDNAAKAVMQRFYTSVVGGGSKGAALREAQLALLAKPETAHPFFWAPFVLIGNWQ